MTKSHDPLLAILRLNATASGAGPAVPRTFAQYVLRLGVASAQELKPARSQPALMRLATWAILSVLVLRAAAIRSLPEPSGSYGIARVSYQLVDRNRPEPLSFSPDARRKMMVHVWYPTDRQSKRGEAT